MGCNQKASDTEVHLFLTELRDLLNDPKFDVRNDLFLIQKKKNEEDSDPFTTKNTMLALGFDSRDVCAVLLTLEVINYKHTQHDSLNQSTRPFFVFEKTIQGRSIYIKIKIQQNRQVFCISFHFSRFAFEDEM